MATRQYELVDPPTEARARQLWLQHAAGFIVFEHMRRYAMERIDPALKGDARAAVKKGIDDAVYGLMMIMDGVTGALSNVSHTVYIDFIVRVAARSKAKTGCVLSELELRQGDGMCMGYHGWIADDFGRNPVAVPQEDTDK